MKRFYCTVCQKLKRVRRYPMSVEMVNAELPVDRVGQCTTHTQPRIRVVKSSPRRIERVIQAEVQRVRKSRKH